MATISNLLTGINSEINKTRTYMEQSRQELSKKGVSVPSQAQMRMSKMPSLISQIPTSAGITPTGTLDITKNGTYDVKNYAFVNVQVPQMPIITNQNEVDFALTQYVDGQRIHKDTPMQIEVGDHNSDYITVNDGYVNTQAVYIERMFLPDDQAAPRMEPNGDYLTTEFYGFQNSQTLRYLGVVYQGYRGYVSPAPIIPTNAIHTWFQGCPFYDEGGVDYYSIDPNNWLLFKGVWGWGACFSNDFYQEEMKDPHFDAPCLNLSVLALHPDCILDLIDNLYDVSQIQNKEIYLAVSIDQQQLFSERWDHLWIDAATAKGWKVGQLK